jgi:hypothetical protein
MDLIEIRKFDLIKIYSIKEVWLWIEKISELIIKGICFENT